MPGSTNVRARLSPVTSRGAGPRHAGTTGSLTCERAKRKMCCTNEEVNNCLLKSDHSRLIKQQFH